MIEKKRLGQMLIESGLISQEKLEEALNDQKESSQKIGSILIRLGYVSQEDITQALSKQIGYPSINLSEINIDEKVIELIKPEIARKFIVIPVHCIGTILTLAMADPSDLFPQEEIRFCTGLKVEAVIAPESSIMEAIDKYYGSSSGIERQNILEALELCEIDTEQSLEMDEKPPTEASRKRIHISEPTGLTPENMQKKWQASGGAGKTINIHTERFRSTDSILFHPSEIENLKKKSVDEIDCSVFSPAEIFVNQTILVQVFVHLPEQREETKNLAREFDEETSRRGFKSLSMPVELGTVLSFNLEIPELVVDEAFQELRWKGRPQSVQFSVSAAKACRTGNTIGTVNVFNGIDVPVGTIKFKINVCPERQAAAMKEAIPIGDQACRFTKAFISYAAKDLNKVLTRVQMMKVLGISYFQDILDLGPGIRWEKELYKHIDECDLFLLFWSSASKESEWVMKEVRYALDRKGGDDFALPEIYPVIIEGPPIPQPPEELSHLHFNDRILYFMGMEGE